MLISGYYARLHIMPKLCKSHHKSIFFETEKVAGQQISPPPLDGVIELSNNSVAIKNYVFCWYCHLEDLAFRKQSWHDRSFPSIINKFSIKNLGDMDISMIHLIFPIQLSHLVKKVLIFFFSFSELICNRQTYKLYDSDGV